MHNKHLIKGNILSFLQKYLISRKNQKSWRDKIAQFDIMETKSKIVAAWSHTPHEHLQCQQMLPDTDVKW